MTDKQKYLRACRFAITKMKEKGSVSITLDIHSDNPTLVKLNDVLNWIEKEYEVEE